MTLFVFTNVQSQAFTTGSCQDDFDNSGNITLADVVLVGPSFNTTLGNPLYHPRFDLNNSNSVTLADIILMGPGFNLPCDGDEYVRAFGQTLYTPSNPNYKFTGVNRYNLASVSLPGGGWLGCGSTWTEEQLQTWFNELDTQNIETVRIWAFQKFTASGTNWTRLDYLLSLADQHGVRVIPTLENHWSACTDGGNKSTTWYAGGYLSPYGGTLSLPDYTALIVNRYKNDDRIAFWQVMNEAETTDATTLSAFADDITTDIQTLDPNHLVSFGTLGAGQQGTQGADYKTLHSLASIDLCEYHDYHHVTEAIPTGSNLLSTRLTQCAELGKPIFIGESGIDTTETPFPTLQQRADYFNAKISAFYAAGGDGYLIWSYRDRDGADSLEYDASDPLATVVGGY
jgi:mannan endo-1,4-beta-mannosidase